MYKSEKLAQNIRQMIENGVWRVHEKLPSLREQTQLSGYSLMTVLNAYQELEAQGLVYARDKSGYYVAERSTDLVNSKQPIQISLSPKVQINSVVFNYCRFWRSRPKEKAVITTRIICRLAIRIYAN